MAVPPSLDTLVPRIRPSDESRIVAGSEGVLRRLARLRGLGSLLRNVRLLVAMLRDPSFHMTWSTRATILAGLLYVVMPVDATPDYLPLIGFVDDTALIALLIRRLNTEIDRYSSARM